MPSMDNQNDDEIFWGILAEVDLNQTKNRIVQ